MSVYLCSICTSDIKYSAPLNDKHTKWHTYNREYKLWYWRQVVVSPNILHKYTIKENSKSFADKNKNGIVILPLWCKTTKVMVNPEIYRFSIEGNFDFKLKFYIIHAVNHFRSNTSINPSRIQFHRDFTTSLWKRSIQEAIL